MWNETFHLSDREMVLVADGELSIRRAAQARAHLYACWVCRARMAEMEGTITDFARAHRQALDSNLPPIDGPRALLKARLAQLRSQSGGYSWQRFFHFTSSLRAVAYVCFALLVVVLNGRFFVQHPALRGRTSAAISFERGTVPDPSLTPGATRAVSLSEVCSMAHEEVVRPVPASVRQQIFNEYGIVNAHADDFEIDYLIAPGLGGSEDTHNLWPEPYRSPTWNARVKDALEERLHQLVCAGKLDLSTAQRDISADWIAAYKKYFHTDEPLPVRSGLLSFRDKSYAVLVQIFVRSLHNPADEGYSTGRTRRFGHVV